MEESGRHYVGQKTVETTKRKSVGSLRGTSLYIRVGNTGTGRETGGGDEDEACVVPACIYGLGTLALAERQEEEMKMKPAWYQPVYTGWEHLH